jgi:hypothetical protein
VGAWGVRGVVGVPRAKWWSQGKVVVTGQSGGHRAKGWSQGKGLVTGQNPPIDRK